VTVDAPLESSALMKRSLLELRKLRARLEELESAGREPIAIIGIGCRFPGGARDPDAFWQMMMEGRDGIVETPPERWDVAGYYSPDPTAPGKTYVIEGGFLDAIDGFDAQFFGISRREALSLDPQQRLLLEVAWEALEHAGQAPDRLYGTCGGVFIGIGSFEYAAHLLRAADVNTIDPYFGTGTALSAAAGRLSFNLGLTGPSMAVDTACSSSLVALHLAAQSLRSRECDLALSGGVNLMIRPEVNVAFSKARLLSSRCRTFDAAGDGYVRGEGCGVIVLRRLSDALRNGDRVIALIRGSAVNQDGPSGALVVPNGVSQETVIRKALDNAGLTPADVDYVEAHGTGTSLGDPIEVGALGRVFGPGRTSDQPLILGSVKTNIGHTESAAGIAGVIKAALSLHHQAIPRHLHFQQRNPRIPWDLAPFVIPTEARSWRTNERRRVAGVSSFGFTGTNAHVILEEAPLASPAPAIADRSAHVLLLSAKSDEALRALASRLAAYLRAHPELDIADVCFSINNGRARFREQLAIVAGSLDELREKLERCDGVRSDKRSKTKTAFVLTGEDAGAARELYASSPTFRDAFDRATESPLQFALARLWESWGIRPAATATRADVEELRRNGFERFITIGPETSSWRQIAETIASLTLHEPSVDWMAFDRDYPRKRLALPTYPFQRERFWIDGKTTIEPPPDLFYRVAWEPKASATSAPDVSGQWLILADRGGVGASLAKRLEARGATCTLRFRGDALDSLAPQLRGAIHLWSLDGESTTAESCGSALQLVQALARATASPMQLILVTRRAQGVTADSDLPGIAHAPLWGLGKAIAVELPWLGCTTIDLDTDDDADALFAEVATSGESVAFRDGRRYVQRLIRATAPPARQAELKSDRTYVIAGGLGGVGLRVASWLAANGARHIALLGRSDRSDPLDVPLAGAEVTVLRANIADEHELAAAFDRVDASMPPIAGVFHCAGVFNDRMLVQHEWPLFEEVFAPKVRGSWNLHLLTRERDLDFFVMFSSAAALLTSPGMSAYIAANTFQDALAVHRRGQGLPALSVAWGPWLDTGMAGRVGRSRENQWRAHGIEPLLPDDALRHLGSLLGREHGHIGIVSVQWPELLRLFAGHVPPYLETIAAGVPRDARTVESSAFERLLAMQPDERTQFLEDYLTRRIAHLLGANELSKTENLPLAGVDSLMIMDVLNGLRDDLRFMVYPREFYEQPTIEGLARYLSAEFERAHHESEPAPPSAARLPIASVKTHFTAEPEGEALPPAVFILSSPRSGSTLLRVMLAGHPALFSPPELHLLPFATMSDRAKLLAGTHLGEGLQRALMELHKSDADAAAAIIDGWVQQNLPVRDVYAALQQRAGSRLLIDKSPSYAVSRDVLARAERLFRSAKYIHLVRHPYAVIESFARLRMDKLIGAGDRDAHAVAERIWIESNRNILNTLAGAGSDRYYRIHYEDLVRDPRTVLAGCCAFLGIPFDEALLTPYAGGRMTEGAHAVSAPVGDPDFLRHAGVEPELGDKWRQIDLGRPLQPDARALAAQFAYELPHDTASDDFRETFVTTARGLRLCVCTWGDDAAPPIVLLHGILEQGAAWMEVAPLMAARGFRVLAPDLRGHGRSDHVGRGGSYHVMDFVADLDAIAAHCGGPFVLAGHSMGSVIAALYAAARPTMVQSLILIETPAPEERTSTAGDAERLATQLDYLSAAPAHPVLPNVEAAAARIMAAQPALSLPLALKLAERSTEPAADGVQWRWDPLLGTRAGLGFGDESNARDRYLGLLRSLCMPLTLIFGRESRIRVPGADPVILGGGHNLHIEKPAGLAEAIAVAATRVTTNEVH